MTTYNKYTWACTGDCDALIEYTYKDGFGWPNGVMQLTCPCNSTCTLLSVEDVTIPYTETKGNEMETTELLVPESYNSDLLVTYKKINDYSNPEYITDKVRNIEWELHNSRTNSKAVLQLQNKIDSVKDIIIEAYEMSDDQDTLQTIAEALGIELTRDIEFTATVEVKGTITLNLLDDYDLESEITDALYVDANNGNIVIDDTEVCNVREAY